MPTNRLKSQSLPKPKAKGKPRSDSKKRTKNPQIADGNEFDEELTFIQQFKHWLKGLYAAGYGISFLVHIFLLLVLSIFYFKSSTPQEPPLLTVLTTEDDHLDFQEIIDVQIDIRIEPEFETQPNNVAEFLTQQAINVKPILSVLETDSNRKIEDKIGFPKPAGGKAVTKGSFTAWTVPEDPKPRQDYLVVIQIRLPEKIKRYRKEDLTGFLTGDDGFKTPIGSYRGSKYSKKYYGLFDDRANQFVIKIPGGAAKVQDTINIQSKMLKEKQVLVIVF